MAGIELGNVSKVYQGSVTALKPTTLTIPEGGLTVLVGPSGCGKSTLLRIIAGLEEPSSGSVTIAGRDVTKVEPADRDIAMVFQNYALYPHMSVYDNMAYGLKNRGTSGADIALRVNEAARMLGIEALLQRKPRALSGGQRQRVAMGRAIVRRPKAFLFDEPLSNLDAKLRGEMRVEIRTLQQRLGVTSVYVTHDQLEAMTMADHLVVMRDGVIVQQGPPGRVYDEPDNVFVAGFLGAPPINLLAGSVGEDGRLHLDCGPQVDLPAFPKLQPGRKVTLGVRAEAISIAAPAANQQATIELIEELGPNRLLHMRFGTAKIICVAPREPALRPGETIPIQLDTAALKLFDPETGSACR
ncbi:MAG: sn-glycerol-3-phosphate ABC transporter ATP-binding protein UgpC [Hyphomicrobiales bacterium]|nr:sn-glycerol-3-phosphate ABC transporter ATP-binding protein UgpC [Hyphomicrobiales bacterium]